MKRDSLEIGLQRRLFLKTTALAALTPWARSVNADSDGLFSTEVGAGVLRILPDGHLSIPFNLPEDKDRAEEMTALFTEAGLSLERREPPCNVSLWQSDDRLVLFDIGAGTQFMDSVGQLPVQLETLGIDPADITDVVFTHAHPDHCWGLLDDFDELLCPNATYHMHQSEFDYWMSEDTLNQTPESGLGMVAGARNRLPLIQEQLEFFAWGDEVVAGVEAVDTHGHTPGHTSFAIHQGNDSVLIVGDALAHEVLSFRRPAWHRPNDIDPDVAAQTRISLLDRLSTDKMRIVGFHLPNNGMGRVERRDDHYHFVES